jgi:mRNA interferase MazF
VTRGKVVLVPFPFDDLSTAKVRPAVCLTDPIGSHRHVILAFISSRTPTDSLESDVVLHSSQADFAKTGLRVSSTLRLHRLMTVTTTLIRRELGELSPRLQGEVGSKLRRLFALTRETGH